VRIAGLEVLEPLLDIRRYPNLQDASSVRADNVDVLGPPNSNLFGPHRSLEFQQFAGVALEPAASLLTATAAIGPQDFGSVISEVIAQLTARHAHSPIQRAFFPFHGDLHSAQPAKPGARPGFGVSERRAL
jgi:hypothetical protein